MIRMVNPFTIDFLEMTKVFGNIEYVPKVNNESIANLNFLNEFYFKKRRKLSEKN